MIENPPRSWRTTTESPRLQRLARDLSREPHSEALVEAFWREIENCGAPLVEDIPGDSAGVAVTFLWRDTTGGACRHVALGGGLVISEFSSASLRRLMYTDVFHLTLRLPRNSRVAYRFGVNDTLEPFNPWNTEAYLARMEHFICDPLNLTRWPQPNASAEGARIMTSSFLDLAPSEDRDIVSSFARADSTLSEHSFESIALRENRTFWVYRPPGDTPIDAVIWSFDGRAASTIAPLHRIVDHLAERGDAPRCAIVYVDSPPRSRQSEMLFQPSFADFVSNELVAEVRRHYSLPSSAGANVLTGYSGGGGAAAYIAQRAPHLFGRALIQSGSTAYMRHGAQPRQLYDWFRQTPPTSTRFMITVGQLEVDRVGEIPSLYQSAHEFAHLLNEVRCARELLEGPYGHDYFAARIMFAKALPHLFAM